jgi:diguanylate cyclase (GGDEF)-like protein
MVQAVGHLIKDHGRRKIAFIKGRSQNYDALERFTVFLSALSSHGILADPEMIVEGDFTAQSGTTAVDILIQERKIGFDAVIASNDDMALAVIKRLRQLGKRVPEDVSVIGFDNLPLGANTVPGLSSIDQHIYRQGVLAVQLLMKKLTVEDPPRKTILETQFVPRTSCGCRSEHVALFLDEPVGNQGAGASVESGDRIEDSLWETLLDRFYREPENRDNLVAFERLIQETLRAGAGYLEISECFTRTEKKLAANSSPDHFQVKRAREFLHLVLSASLGAFTQSDNMERIYSETEYLTRVREMVGASNLDELKNWLTGFFREFGIKKAFVALYPEPIEYHYGDTLKPPPEVIPFLLLKGGVPITTDSEKDDFFLEKFIPDILMAEDHSPSLITYPLFFKDHQYGYALFEKDHLPVYLLNTLADQIGASYRLILSTEERERVEKKLRRVLLELEESNKELFNISKTDELTGLDNRRGFFDQALKTLEMARYRNMGGNLLFIDLDGLKQINDRFGHEQGDKAIIAVAGILKKTFNQGEALARLGGDEFIILSVGSAPDYADEISGCVRDCLAIVNQTGAFPLTLSMSMGASHFLPGSDKTLQKLMAEADDNLYKEKNLKKQKNLFKSGFSLR